mmetsp:Transcript_99831/g.229172  ORF Transcript_99831/g.229172 Transcript_99831/m.229172 type:complete len:347 (+) Transcript_99831:41-1081(+)
MAGDHAKGVMVMSLATLSGSCFGLLMRIGQDFGPWVVVAMRCGPQFVIVFSYCLWYWGSVTSIYRSISRLDAFAAIFLAGQSIGISMAMLMTTVANVFFVINTVPAFCALSDWLVLGETPRRRTVVMVMIALVGIFVIVWGELESDGLFGVLVALINPLSWTVYWGIMRHKSRVLAKQQDTAPTCVETAQSEAVEQKSEDQGTPNTSQGEQCHFEEEKKPSAAAKNPVPGIMMVTVLVLAAFAWCGVMVTGDDRLRVPTYLEVVYFVGFGGVYLPCIQVLYSLAPKYLSTAEVGCLKVMECVYGPIWIWLFEEEVPPLTTIVGGSCIVVAVAGHSFLAAREARSAK